MQAISALQASLQKSIEQNGVFSKLLHVAKVVAKIAAGTIFVLGSLLVAAAALPVECYSIGLSATALISGVLSYNFFHSDAVSEELQPKIVEKKKIPKDFPRGLINLAQNCAFNSLFHFLSSVPDIADWMKNPIAEDLVKKQILEEFSKDPQCNEYSRVELMKGIRGSPYDAKDFLSSCYVKKYKDILTVSKAVSSLQKKCENAIEKDEEAAFGSQGLRSALNQVNPLISPNARSQQDAGECLSAFLSVFPEKDQIRCKISRQYDLSQIPQAERPDSDTKETEQQFSCIPLSVPDRPALHLQNMLDEELDHAEKELSSEFIGKNQKGKFICPSLRTTMSFSTVPKALPLQLKRYQQKQIVSQEGDITYKMVKNSASVQVPQELKIKVAGQEHVYELTSFIHHAGSSPQEGHYIAGRIIGGKKYLFNDERVTLDDPKWEQSLSSAYLLCYIPKARSQDQFSATLPV